MKSEATLPEWDRGIPPDILAERRAIVAVDPRYYQFYDTTCSKSRRVDVITIGA
jgi:hypothetical protein